MRKIALFLLLFAPMCLMGQTTRDYVVNFSEKDFSLTKDGDIVRIVSTDGKATIWGDTLDPALPCIGVYILIGPMDDYAGFSYEGHETLVESNVIIDYNPASLPTNIHQVVKRSHKIDYAKKTYPEENVQFTGTHTMDGYKILSFVMCPFRYDAENKSLYFEKDFNLHLNLKPLSSKEYPRSPGMNMCEVVREMTINGNEMETLYPNETRIASATNATTYKYVIITNQSLKPAFEKLVRWKTIKGVRSKVITVEECYNAYPTLTQQLAIKTVLSNYYYNNGLEYALLGGDTNVVPIQLCYIYDSLTNTTDTPADLYYACLNNNFAWDANGNQIYGEDTDNIDFMPEFIVSRSSVSTLAEAEIFVNRIIEYECSPKLEGWTKSMLCCGNIIDVEHSSTLHSDSEHYGQYVYQYGVQNYWDGTLFRLFDTYSDNPDTTSYDATGEHFQRELKKGYTFVEEISHGWVNKWGLLENATVYNLDKADSLVNNGYTIIATSACYTNAFDKVSTDFPDEEEYYTTCLSESFMRNPNSGILAYWGSSREGMSNHSYIFDKEFYKKLLSGNEKQFGRAAMLAKITYIVNIPITGYNDYRWLIMTINPMGDPEMPVYTDVPQSFNNIVVNYLNGNLSVTTGVSGCTICVSSAADFGDSYYNLSNNVNGTNLSGINTDCYLCITKKGYIPYVARIGNSVFLQNEDIVRNLSVFSTNTYAGSNVNSSIPQGPVSIQKGKVTNKSAGSITIQSDFEVKEGGELEIIVP